MPSSPAPSPTTSSCFHYQPIVEVRSGRITAVEALLRWSRGDDTLVAPGEFIGDLERMGLSKEMTIWGIRRAVQDVGSVLGGGGRRLELAINLSPSVCMHPDLPELVEQTSAWAAFRRARSASRSPSRARCAAARPRSGWSPTSSGWGPRSPSTIRHRLLVAPLPARVPGRRGEDRRLVRPRLKPGNDDATLCAAVVSWPTRSASRSPPKGREARIRSACSPPWDAISCRGSPSGDPSPRVLGEVLRAHGGYASAAIRQLMGTNEERRAV